MDIMSVWGGTIWYPGHLTPTGHEYAFAFVLLGLVLFLWIAIFKAFSQ